MQCINRKEFDIFYYSFKRQIVRAYMVRDKVYGRFLAIVQTTVWSRSQAKLYSDRLPTIEGGGGGTEPPNGCGIIWWCCMSFIPHILHTVTTAGQCAQTARHAPRNLNLFQRRPKGPSPPSIILSSDVLTFLHTYLCPWETANSILLYYIAPSAPLTMSTKYASNSAYPRNLLKHWMAICYILGLRF